jgi:hypothetical protein
VAGSTPGRPKTDQTRFSGEGEESRRTPVEAFSDSGKAVGLAPTRICAPEPSYGLQRPFGPAPDSDGNLPDHAFPPSGRRLQAAFINHLLHRELLHMELDKEPFL